MQGKGFNNKSKCRIHTLNHSVILSSPHIGFQIGSTLTLNFHFNFYSKEYLMLSQCLFLFSSILLDSFTMNMAMARLKTKQNKTHDTFPSLVCKYQWQDGRRWGLCPRVVKRHCQETCASSYTSLFPVSGTKT